MQMHHINKEVRQEIERCLYGFKRDCFESYDRQQVECFFGDLPTKTGTNRCYFIKPKEQTFDRLWVTLHGFGNSGFYPLAPFIGQVLNQGDAALVLELPGHGLGSSNEFSADELANDFIRQQIESVLQDFPQTKTIFGFAQSFGGACLLSALLDGSVKLDKTFLIGCPLALKNDPIAAANLLARELSSLLRPSLHADLFYGIKLFGLWGAVPAFGPLKRKVFPVRTRTAALNTIADYLERQKFTAQLPRYEGSDIHFVYGKYDPLTPKIFLKQLVEKNERIKLKEVACNHVTSLWSGSVSQYVKEQTAKHG